MASKTTGKLNLWLTKMTDKISDTISTYLYENFTKIDTEFSAHTADMPTMVNDINNIPVDATVLIFPQNKTFVANSTITIPSTVRKIIGNNATISSQFHPCIDILNDNIVIENITLNGENNNTKIQHGIRIADSVENTKLNNCIIKGFSVGVLGVKDNIGVTVSSCDFSDCYNYQGDASSGYGIILQNSQKTIIKDCNFTETVYRHAIYISRIVGVGISRNHIIENCKFYGRGYSGDYITGAELPLKIMGSQDVKIVKNAFINTLGGILIDALSGAANENCEDIIITNNTFDTIFPKTENTACISCMPRLHNIKKMIISDNIAKNISCKFVLCSNFEDVIISNNIVNLINDISYKTRFIYSHNSTLLKNLNIANNLCNLQDCKFIDLWVNGVVDSVNINNNTITINTLISDLINMRGVNSEELLTIKDMIINNNIIKSLEIVSSPINVIILDFNVAQCDGTITNNRFNYKEFMTIKCTVPLGELIYFNNLARQNISTELATLFDGKNHKEVYRSGIPTTGNWLVGDRVINNAPIATGYLGWVCITSGAPGEWKGYGLIQE